MRRPRMTKGKRRLLIIVLAVAVVLSGFLIWVRARNAVAKVYRASDFAIVDPGMGGFGGFGGLTLDAKLRQSSIHSIFLSHTQKVQAIRVKNGDRVKKGQPLVAYDSTLDKLALEKLRLSVELARLQEKKLQEELDEILQLRPGAPRSFFVPESFEEPEPPLSGTNEATAQPTPEPTLDPTPPVTPAVSPSPTPTPSVTPTPGASPTPGAAPSPSLTPTPSPSPTPTPTATPTPSPAPQDPKDAIHLPVYVEGEGLTPSQPAVYDLHDQTWLDASIYPILLGDKERRYIRFRYGGEEEKQLDVLLERSAAGPFPFRMRVLLPDDKPGQGQQNELPKFPELPDPGPSYSAKEIYEMRIKKEGELRDAALRIKELSFQAQSAEQELKNSEILSPIDGVVDSLLDPEQAKEEKKALLRVVADQKTVVESAVSEYQLNSVKKGDAVSVMDYTDGSIYEGTISWIGTSANAEGSGYGPANVAYFPIEISLRDAVDLSQSYGMQVQLNAPGEMGLFYLDSAFIVREDGRAYVWLDQNGRLEKRELELGRGGSMGDYVEIRSGLNPDDWIAFPYSVRSKEGARTKRTEREAFQGGFF